MSRIFLLESRGAVGKIKAPQKIVDSDYNITNLGKEDAMTEGPIGFEAPDAPKGEISRLVRGKRLGKYRLQKRLGKGGYCEIWEGPGHAGGHLGGPENPPDRCGGQT